VQNNCRAFSNNSTLLYHQYKWNKWHTFKPKIGLKSTKKGIFTCLLGLKDTQKILFLRHFRSKIDKKQVFLTEKITKNCCFSTLTWSKLCRRGTL